MHCNDISICITFLILMATLKNPAFAESIQDLPDRQELFPGLLRGKTNEKLLALQTLFA